MPLIIHFLVENTIYLDRALFVLLIKDNVMSHLKTKEPRAL